MTDAREEVVKEKSAAIVTIFKANGMSPAGRKHLARWLRVVADRLVKEGEEYAPRFTSRYVKGN